MNKALQNILWIWNRLSKTSFQSSKRVNFSSEFVSLDTFRFSSHVSLSLTKFSNKIKLNTVKTKAIEIRYIAPATFIGNREESASRLCKELFLRHEMLLGEQKV